MARYNFTEITLQDKADITTVMNNFNKIENTGAIIDDLTKVYQITLSASNWITVGTKYEYIINNEILKAAPYNIQIIFTDLTIINGPIYPKPNSQAEGSLTLQSTVKPTVDLVANVLITRGFEE